jgi:hypothetical protein
MITPNKTVSIFRVYTKFYPVSKITWSTTSWTPFTTLPNVVNHVLNSIYHVTQRGQPRLEPRLPRYTTWSTTSWTPFTTLHNVVNLVLNPVYPVTPRGWLAYWRGTPRFLSNCSVSLHSQWCYYCTLFAWGSEAESPQTSVAQRNLARTCSGKPDPKFLRRGTPKEKAKKNKIL